MSTVVEQKNGRQLAVAKPAEPKENIISYIPLGEREEIHLTLNRVKQFLCIPTRSGKMPTDEQVVKYMMLCKAQSLNPWVNDAYLVGYDGKDGPQFSLITAHQSFLKRAEASPEFDGIESGVVVSREGEITERPGDLLLNGEILVGAWARVHRRDRKIASYDALNLKTFDTGRSRWAADPAGMIVKCAEASALRKAFPSTLAAMYCKEEMDRERTAFEHSPHSEQRPKADRLAGMLIQSPPAKTDGNPAVSESVGSQSTASDGDQNDATVDSAAVVAEIVGTIKGSFSPDTISDMVKQAMAMHRDGALSDADLDVIKAAKRDREELGWNE